MVSLSELVITVFLHCLALLNLVAFLNSSGSPWEDLVLVQVHYLTVGSALPHCFVEEGVHELSFATSIFCIFTRSQHGVTSIFMMLVSLHLFFIGSCIWTGSPGFNNSSSLVACLSKQNFYLSLILRLTHMLLFFVSSLRLFLNFLSINISAGDNPCSSGLVWWISNPNNGSWHFLSMFIIVFIVFFSTSPFNCE